VFSFLAEMRPRKCLFSAHNFTGRRMRNVEQAKVGSECAPTIGARLWPGREDLVTVEAVGLPCFV
jgi:hypothetical protein